MLDNQEGALTQEDLESLYAESLSRFEVGKVVKGRILSIGPDEVLVDIGYKSEGYIPISEFRDVSQYKVGDEVGVYLEEREDEDGTVVLSKQKADRIVCWEKTLASCKQGKVIRGKIFRKVKGGLMVDIGMEAFLPASQVDVKPIRYFEDYIGKTFEFKVININEERKNIVLSRRELLEEERKKDKEKILSEIQVGEKREGIVKNITDFGAFIDLKGIDGLLHITDMSWGRVNHPSEVLAVGDKVEVKVLDFNRDRERVSLGLKQLMPNPWLEVDKKYPLGSVVKGRVVNIMPYGAFVELEKGVEGLLHVSELSWTRRVNHPNEILAIGDVVETMVLSIDKDNEKISLGLKQTEANPWTLVEEKFPVGMRVKGKVRNLTSYGAFVELEDGVDGLLHVSDLSWTRKVGHPSEVVRKGEVIEALVLFVDSENKKISLGLKQLQEDPWDTVLERYQKGQSVEGTVTKVTGFGAFVELEDGIEGLVHISQLDLVPVKEARSIVKEGDRLKAMVVKIDPKERKIALSVKEYLVNKDRFDEEE